MGLGLVSCWMPAPGTGVAIGSKWTGKNMTRIHCAVYHVFGVGAVL